MTRRVFWVIVPAALNAVPASLTIPNISRGWPEGRVSAHQYRLLGLKNGQRSWVRETPKGRPGPGVR
jgi:hypothetical protein